MRLRRLRRLCSGMIGLLTLVQTVDATPPNLVFVLSDDQGIEALDTPEWSGSIFDAAYAGLNQNEYPRPGAVTRNLNSYAMQGVTFTNLRQYPNCSPTRACMMTGRNAFRHGMIGVIGRPGVGVGGCTDEGGLGEYDIEGTWPEEIAQLSVQGYEYTMAEMLQDAGYYTILIDKWHVGEEDFESTQSPFAQGFDAYYDWLCDVYCSLNDGRPCRQYDICDDPSDPDDEHLSVAVDRAIAAFTYAVEEILEPGQPYALFFHTITPHRRTVNNGYYWWSVSEDLAPQTIDLEATLQLSNPQKVDQQRRYTMNVEALDTSIGQLLFGLGIVDSPEPGEGDYVPPDDEGELGTVVIFTSDNGTDPLISVHGTSRAKNSLYDGGLRVPLIVFGEGIDGNAGDPITDDRLISSVDFFATVADIAEYVPDANDPETVWPTESMSFADDIGYADSQNCPEREFCLSSLGLTRPAGEEDCESSDCLQIWKLALVHRAADGHLYKLICRSGGPGMADVNGADCTCTGGYLDFECDGDVLYDLTADPGEEDNLLALSALTDAQVDAYLTMRDRVTRQWPSAVSEPFGPASIPTYEVTHMGEDTGNNEVYLLTTTYVAGERDSCAFTVLAGQNTYELDFSVACDTIICPQGVNQTTCDRWQDAFDALLTDDTTDFNSGETFPDAVTVDVPAATIRWAVSPGLTITPPSGSLPVGHLHTSGATFREFQTFLRFTDLTLPTGFDSTDIVDAQIIMSFMSDAPDPTNQGTETDTGIIRVRPGAGEWWEESGSVYDDFEPGSLLGLLDLAPHIIGSPVSEQPAIRVLPVSESAPIAFAATLEGDGSDANTALVDLVQDWIADEETYNFGVALVADKINQSIWGSADFSADQHVYFKNTNVWLRLTLRK